MSTSMPVRADGLKRNFLDTLRDPRIFAEMVGSHANKR
jgi:hypothetical protein